MWNRIALTILAISLLIIAVGSIYIISRNQFKYDINATHYAVLLSSGDAFYTAISEVDDNFIYLKEVHFVQTTADQETKNIKNTLYKRGGEWHAPTSMIVNRAHVVFIEPVNNSSKVDKLIKEIKSK